MCVCVWLCVCVPDLREGEGENRNAWNRAARSTGEGSWRGVTRGMDGHPQSGARESADVQILSVW